ncbi:MAG: hypothetical protein FWD71_21385 [Oscillospiraceae bacterium]|nr:hypothetical protein [Oscillospiraceae bacterium]
MDYISVRQAADKWGISVRWVQTFLKNNRIKGVVRINNYAWMIPTDAKKPIDPRHEKKPPKCSLSVDLAQIIEATILPMPQDNPDAILDILQEERLRLHLEGELAYLRGDFERTKNCFRKTENDEASRLRASSVAIAAAIGTGDYPFYMEVETFLKDFVNANRNDRLSVFAELCLANAYTSAFAPDMVPDWLKNGDFAAIHPLVRPDAAYKRAKYFHCLGKYDSMLAVAQTTLSFCESPQKITFHDIYFRIVCAIASNALGDAEKTRYWLSEAMNIALPYGFITPFAESAPAFGGQMEWLLDSEYPEYYDVITNQWKRTYTNWLAFHNRFTKDNITLILSLREYEMTWLAVRGIPYAKIAEQFHISVGRVKRIIHEIYGKLLVNNRNELSKYIL